jgi:uncharacterized metal-binding protein
MSTFEAGDTVILLVNKVFRDSYTESFYPNKELIVPSGQRALLNRTYNDLNLFFGFKHDKIMFDLWSVETQEIASCRMVITEKTIKALSFDIDEINNYGREYD